MKKKININSEEFKNLIDKTMNMKLDLTDAMSVIFGMMVLINFQVLSGEKM